MIMVGWIKFDENSKLTNDRVSIAYDTHDDRGIRYAYGYFQFVGGKCICFWKDGHHLSRTVKVEDIRYWMPIPAFDAVEECSEDEENIFRLALDKYLSHYEDMGLGISLHTRRVAKFFFDLGLKVKPIDFDVVRDDFAQDVYRILDADPTNDRANQIIDAFDRLPTVIDKFVWHDKSEKPEYDKSDGALNLIAVAGVTKGTNGHVAMSVASLQEDGKLYSPISDEEYEIDGCKFTKWAYVDELANV